MCCNGTPGMREAPQMSPWIRTAIKAIVCIAFYALWGAALACVYSSDSLGIYLVGFFLLIAAPVGWFMWRDHGFPPTACQSCGYDLSGAAHEKCPECGAQID